MTTAAGFRAGIARRVKRALDVMFSLTALTLAAPVMAVIAVLIRFDMGTPVLFRQVRPGYRARPFSVIKFRTMSDRRGPDGAPLPEHLRLTRLGHVLRLTSLDELPQLWTILKGDMSLVGPRPLLMEYLDHYTPEQARRHEVPPGLTGWAQVHGRALLDFEKRFEYDVWYVDHWSLGLDLRILWLTVGKVLRSEGLPPSDHVFVPFDGSPASTEQQADQS